MDIDCAEARRMIARLTPAQIRMVQLRAEGNTHLAIARRFNGCRDTVIAAQIATARDTLGVKTDSDLVDIWLAAQR